MDLNLKSLKPISVENIISSVEWILEQHNQYSHWNVNFDHAFVKSEIIKTLNDFYEKEDKKEDEKLKNTNNNMTIKELEEKIIFNNLNIPKKGSGSGKNNNVVKKDLINILKNIKNIDRYTWDDFMSDDLDIFKKACWVLYDTNYRFYEYLMGYFLCIGKPQKCMIGLQERGHSYYGGRIGDGENILRTAYTVINEHPKSFAYAIAYYYGMYDYKYEGLSIDILDVTFPVTKNNTLLKYIKWVEIRIKRNIINDNTMRFDRPYLENGPEDLIDEEILNNELKLIDKSETKFLHDKREEFIKEFLYRANLVC